MGKIFPFIIIVFILAISAGIGFYIAAGNQKATIIIEDLDGGQKEFSVDINQLTPNQNFNAALSIPWYISRSSAIAAYILMFLIVIWGLGMTSGFTYRIEEPAKAWNTHQFMAISLVILILTHISSLLFDKFINFGWKDILILFFSSFKPAYLSLGIIGFYILIAIILISLFLRIKKPRFWRITHYLTYLLFVMSLIHGLFIGTDSSSNVMKIIYLVTGVIFTFLIIYRFLLNYILKIFFKAFSAN